MLINEIHQLKTDFDTLVTPEAVLAKYGWKLLGTGTEAAVAEHPTKDYVLKVFLSKSNFKQFVKFVVDHKGNPHLPIFISGSEANDMLPIQENRRMTIPGIMSNIPGTRYSFIRIERLDKISERNLMKNYAPEMLYVYLEGLKLGLPGVREEMYTAMRQKIMIWNQLQGKPKAAIDAFIRTLVVDTDQRTQLWEKLGRSPDAAWVSVVQELFPFTKTMNRRGLDLDANNVMLRGNTLVIIDPFV